MRQLITIAVLVFFFFSCQGKDEVKEYGDLTEKEIEFKSDISDEQIMDIVQKQTFKYFWDFAHPVSGLIRERSMDDDNVTTTGGTGFGVMALVVGVERGYITREQFVDRMLKMSYFLRDKATRYHGAWSHWIYGDSGHTKAFSANDDGADLVETAFLVQGLMTVKQYVTADNAKEKELVTLLNELCDTVEWDWFTNNTNALYWHWSPSKKWIMDFPIRGFNECMITYIIAASSKTHPIKAELYNSGWAGGSYMGGINVSKVSYRGGPLFFTHYSFLGLNPKISDKYIKSSKFRSYFERNKEQTLLNKQFCMEQRSKFPYYGENCWGLTASDDPYTGYYAHEPSVEKDNGTITPTAAISSIVYTPRESLDLMKYLYETYKDKGLWGEYGFTDAFNLKKNWYAKSYIAIDQGPIVVMIENYRTGLLWNLFMKNPEIISGLQKCGINTTIN